MSAAPPALRKRLTFTGTDAEFAAILEAYGPERVVAIVHTVAYANFHNRILLGLGAGGDPVPPAAAAFDDAGLAKVPTPARPPRMRGDVPAVPLVIRT